MAQGPSFKCASAITHCNLNVVKLMMALVVTTITMVLKIVTRAYRQVG